MPWIRVSPSPTYFVYGRCPWLETTSSRAGTQSRPLRVYENVGFQLPPRQNSHSLPRSWIGFG